MFITYFCLGECSKTILIYIHGDKVYGVPLNFISLRTDPTLYYISYDIETIEKFKF